MDGSHTQKEFPVVLRFKGLYPHHLAGYEAHRLRKGGDLGHVDRSRSGLNKRLIGEEDWAAKALAEIKEMTAENFAAELESLEKRNRKADLVRRMVEGPKQPWRPTKHGPMREVILSANKEWFAGDLGVFFGETENQREKDFEERAIAWLEKNFGESVIHARADRDEAAYHIHAVIMPRTLVEIAKPKAKTKVATAKRWMLQPSIHPLIESYEAAQDSVGEWFKDLGLVRGERRVAAIKAARDKGENPPKRRYHAKTWQWRAAEERRLAEKARDLEAREAAVERREAEAETVLAVADGLASGAFEVDASSETPELVETPQPRETSPAAPDLSALRARSPAGFGRAAGVFGRAWQRMFGVARAKAENEAAAGVAAAVQQIADADEKIVEITRLLPREQRSIIGKIRQTIPAILRRLEQRAGAAGWREQGPRGRAGEREKE